MQKLLTFLRSLNWLNILCLLVLIAAVVLSFWYPAQSLTLVFAGIGLIMLAVSEG